jgi:hypothetical protein
MHNHVYPEEEFIVDSYKKVCATFRAIISLCLRTVGQCRGQRGLPSLLVSLKQGGQGQVDQLDTHSLPQKGLQMPIIPKCLA